LATYPGPIADVALAPDGGAVCFATGSRAVLWDLAAPEERRVFQAGDAALTDVAFAPSGTWLATADERGAVRLWTVRTGRELRSLEGHAGRVNAVTFSSDSRQVFSAGADGALRVWTVSSGNLRKCYTGHAGGALCVAVSGDGALAAVGLGDGTVRVWDLREHEVQRIFDAHAAAVTGLCFAPDSARLASVSADGTARVFDLATGHAIKAMCDRNDTGAAGNDNAAGFAAVAFAPDGARVFTAGGPGRNAVWDCCHALTGTMTEVVADTNLYRSQRLADGTALCPRGGSIEVAPGVPPGAAAALGTPIVTGHARAVTATTFSPDGRRFVTVSTDQTVKLWDVATRREVLTLSAVPLRSYTDVAFSADGCTLFASDGRGASVWDAVPRSTVNTEESRQ
jgi:WD40 repeat protein